MKIIIFMILSILILQNSVQTSFLVDEFIKFCQDKPKVNFCSIQNAYIAEKQQQMYEKLISNIILGKKHKDKKVKQSSSTKKGIKSCPIIKIYLDQEPFR